LAEGDHVYRLIDSHAHLEELDDLDPAIDRARQNGLVAVVAVGSDHQSNSRAMEIAARYAGFVYPALGMHPGMLHQATPSLDQELHFIEDHLGEAVAIGEVGLDYHKRVLSSTNKDRQHGALSMILSLGKKHNKPVIIHSRYAWRDSFALTQGAGVERAVFHWYTGPGNVLKDILDAGYFVSATLAAEYHAEHRRAVKEAPLEKLLLETDCPVAYQGHRSEPADVTRSLRAAAELKGLSPDVVAEKTTQNAVSLFGLLLDSRLRGNDKRGAGDSLLPGV
jgi:TatD DNase family protein